MDPPSISWLPVESGYLQSGLRGGEHVAGQLDQFLRWWFGPPSRDVELDAGASLPRALSEWYAAEEAWGKPLAAQNTILRPSELRNEGSYTVFYVENQAVWLWAFGADQEVYDRENTVGAPWSITGARLIEFLVHAAMFEATIGSPIGAVAIDINRTTYERAVSCLTPVAMTPWHWPGPNSRLFISEGALLFGGVNDRPDALVTDASRYEIMVAARSHDDLAFLDDLGVEWSYNSRLFGEGVYR